MDALETVVVLGLTVLAGAMLASRLRVATPPVLLVLGLVLGFIPQLRGIQLPPEAVLLIFLPVILFWESLTTSLQSIRRDLRGIVLLSTLLVVATAFAVAGVAHLLGLPWNAALILGAALAPPDATAVAALGRMLPRRNYMLLKAESLTNDGTALVLYAIAVGVTAGGNYTVWDVSALVVRSYLGGAITGAVIGAIAYAVMRRQNNPLIINLALLVTPFTAFLGAELIGGSGVLAVVVAGLIVSATSNRTSTAASRRQTESAWPLGSVLLNGALFVLIGLEAQAVTRVIDVREIPRLVLITVAVWVALMIVRFAFQTLSVSVIRLLDRRPSQLARRMSYRDRVVSSVAGFRGAVSLAITLSVPLTLSNGQPLPGRDEILFITAGVIVLTLLLQGPALRPIVRWARLENNTDKQEVSAAEKAITQDALAALSEMYDSGEISGTVRDRLQEEYRTQLALMDEAQPSGTSTNTESDADEYRAASLALLMRKREALHKLLRAGNVDDTIARRVQARLDVEEQSLLGIDPVE